MSNPWASSFDEYRQTIIGEKRRWQDDDGDGKWYEKSDVDGKISKREKKSHKHNCASKVKHEEFGVGNPVKGMHDLDENGVVQHYDVFFEHGVEKNVPVSSLEILEGGMHEHVIHEGKKNCGCGQDPCITYGEGKNAHKMPDGTVMPGKTHKEDMSKDKEGHTTGGFRISNKEAKAAKGRLKDKVAKKREQISTLKKEEVVDEGLLDNLKAKVNKKLATSGRNFKGGSVSQMGNYAEKSLNSEEAVDNYVKEDEIINNIDGTTTEIIDVIKAPKMVAAPKFSNWREDFVWDEPVDEALKTPKLDIDAEKGKVKNKIEVNPTVETEAYDNTKSPDYKKKKKALAKKHGGAKNIKGHPQYEHHQKDENGNEIPHEQLDEIDNLGGKVGGVLATGAVMGGLKLMGAAKNAAERLRKKKTDAMKQYEEVEKKNFDEGKVKYYSGQDRDKNTGLPKGLKASPVRTEKEVNKKLDRTTLAQSYEPEGESIVDEGLGDAILGGLKKVDSAVTKASNTKVGKPIAGALKKVFGPWKSTDGGSNRTSPTAASQKAKGLRVSEGYQRNPERDTRSARQRRMDSPDRGINSQAFRDFMAAQQSKPKKKKKEVKKESVEGMAALQKAQKAHLGIKSNPFNLPDITSANNAILKKQGLGHSMTGDGQNINFGATARKQFDKVTAATQDPAHASKLKAMGTSAAQMKKTGDDLAWKAEREINQYTPGTVAHQNVGVEKDLAAFGSQFKPKKNTGFKLGVNSYEPKGDVIDELNRYEKETGESSGSMNMPKGRPTKKGGTSSPVMRAVRTSIRKETGKPHGQQKKTKGEKGNRQVGDRRTTPADSIAKRRQSKKDADAAMRDTRGT